MEHTEFERLAPILRTKAKQIGLSFFKKEEAAKKRDIKMAAAHLGGCHCLCVKIVCDFCDFVIL